MALPSAPGQRIVRFMKHSQSSDLRTICKLWALALLLGSPSWVSAEPAPSAVSAVDAYIRAVESRLNQQHRSRASFLASGASDPDAEPHLRRGELIVEQLTPLIAETLPGAMLHHWRGTAFVAGGKASDFERLMKEFDAYPQRLKPQVLPAKVLEQQGDRFWVLMRVRQHHGITVVMDTVYDVTFGQFDPGHGYSLAHSTRISEIVSAGTRGERALDASEEHGFLWRLNTYWSCAERDGGLYMQIESVSLTRDIPRGLAWAVRPFVQSIPRDSLEFTLGSACRALRKRH
jgi:hypothetical protein